MRFSGGLVKHGLTPSVKCVKDNSLLGSCDNIFTHHMMTPSNENIFRVTGPLRGEIICRVISYNAFKWLQKCADVLNSLWYMFTDTRESSWWQHCRHRWYERLSSWQPLVPCISEDKVGIITTLFQCTPKPLDTMRHVFALTSSIK